MKKSLVNSLFIFSSGFATGCIFAFFLFDHIVIKNYVEPCEIYLPIGETCRATSFPKSDIE